MFPFFFLILVFLKPLIAAEGIATENDDERKRKAFKDVVEFVLNFSDGAREFDEESLEAELNKPELNIPEGYGDYGSKVVYMLKNLTELENKRPQLLNITDQEAHWIFDPKEFLRKKTTLRLEATEVTWDYRVTFRRAQLRSQMNYMEFLDYLKATLMYETLYTQQEVKANWGNRFPTGLITTNTLPLWYQSEGWLKDYEKTLRIPKPKNNHGSK